MAGKLSIIIVTYNCADYLRNCLVSIYNNPPSCEFDIYVIDNNSQDNVVPMLKEEFPQVNVIANKDNKGFSAANNQALRESKSSYFLLLNPDTLIPEKNTLGLMVEFLENHPQVAVVGCMPLDGNNNVLKEVAFANVLPSPLVLLYTKSSILKHLLPKKFKYKLSLFDRGIEDDYQGEIEVKSIPGSCLMLKKEVLQTVGLMDEDYFLYIEETDWCYRIRQKGWKIFHLPQVSYVHFGQVSAEQIGRKANVELEKGLFLFSRKHYGRFKTKLVRDYLVFEHTLKFSLYQVLAKIYPPKRTDLQEKISILENILCILKQVKL